MDDSTRRQLVDEHRRNKEEDLNYSGCSRDNHIPIDLTAEILSRLPIKSIGRFTSVCKIWRGLIASTSFSSMHARNSPFYTILATSSPDPRNFHNSSMLIQVSKNCDSAVRANLGTRAAVGSRSRRFIAGSCNGLLCTVDRVGPGPDRIIISNLITNESAVVARSSYDGKGIAAHYRFGYSPSTNEYKVLRRLYSAHHEVGPADPFAIFTVGVDETWRNLPSGLFPNHLWERAVDDYRWIVPPSGGSVGAFHWIASDTPDIYESSVLAFDIAEEKTRTFVPFPRPADRINMVSSDDPLCLYFRDNKFHVVLSMGGGGGGGGGGWRRAVVPSGAFMVLENGDFCISSIESLDRAIGCGGLLFWVEGGNALRSYCPKSEEYAAILFRHDDGVRLLCGFTPSFCSISEIVR